MYAPEQLGLVLTNPDLEAIRKSYLAEFAATKAIRPESARLILQTEQYPDLVSHALDILLKRQEPTVVDYLLGKVAAGAFSEHDALTFLKLDAQFTLQALRQQPNSPIQERMILALLPLVSDTELVKLEDRVRTEAGWGRIQKILLDDRERLFFDPHHEMPILNVILRPGEHSVRVVVDLKRKSITFANSTTLYQCTKAGCAGFISPARDDVTYQTQPCCSWRIRAPHSGNYRQAPGSFRAAMQYARQQPADMFA